MGDVLYAQSPDAGTATIRGTVMTSDGKPAAFVTLKIEHSKWVVVTNEQGAYTILKVKPGTWTLKASAVGLVSQEKQITVQSGQELQADFNLKESAEYLEGVTVSSGNLNKKDEFVAKIPLKNLENPQVYSQVSSELMKQQGVTSYDDAMRNVPGISRTWEATGRAGDGGSYFALRGFDAQPSLTNGLPGLTSGNLDPADVEEIQVLKGPSGTLFGGSFYSYGGIINTITKKPYDGYGGEIGYNFGSYGLNRITADVNAVLSKKDKIALRVNTAYHTESSFQDAGFKKSFFIAPSLSYEVNDKLSFRFLAEIMQEERAVPPVFFNSDRFSPLRFKNLQELNLNNQLSFTSNDLTMRNPRLNVQAQMLYKFSKNWTSQTTVSRGSVTSDGIYTYIWDDALAPNYFSQYFHNEQETTTTTDIQQNFNGDFKIAGVRNRLLLGFDYFRRNIIDNGSGWAWARNVTPQGDVSYVDPFSGDTLPPVYLTRSSIDQLLASTEPAKSNVTNSSYGVYASDVISIGKHLMAMVSLRADYFDTKSSASEDNYNQWALSPKFGLVYQVLPDKLSLFANYMNAFINVAPIAVIDPDSNQYVKSFKPEQANQWEYGIKASLFANKLFATISVYDIKVSDRVTGVAGYPFWFVQGGKVGSKGVEFDLTAHPAPGLSLVAGYSHNSTKVIDGNKEDFYSEPGRSPGGQGPQDLANFWANYQFTQGKLKDFGFGIGGNYAGKYKVIDNSATGIFYLPSYTLLNASLFYNASKIRVGFNLNNVTNTTYYIGYWSVNPQRLRNYVMSIAYKF